MFLFLAFCKVRKSFGAYSFSTVPVILIQQNFAQNIQDAHSIQTHEAHQSNSVREAISPLRDLREWPYRHSLNQFGHQLSLREDTNLQHFSRNMSRAAALEAKGAGEKGNCPLPHIFLQAVLIVNIVIMKNILYILPLCKTHDTFCSQNWQVDNINKS